MIRRFKIILAIVLLALGVTVSQLAYSADPKFEREVLFPVLTVRILGYVDWPPKTEAEGAEPRKLKIGVYDKTPGREYFREFRKLRRQFDSFELVNLSGGGDDLAGVDIVYIAGDGTEVPKELKAAYVGKPVLVLKESSSFGDVGAIVRFEVTEDNKAAYGIHLPRANESGLKFRALFQRKAVELVR